MGKWLAAALLAGVATSCSYGTGAYSCDTDDQCPGGQCEPGVQLCSRADATCDSGRRFGDLAGDQSGQCVGDTSQPPIDAPETPVDAPPACYGAGLVKVCIDAAPTTPLTTPTTLDTDTSPLCQHVQSGGDFCVLAGTTITVSQTLRATGHRPLVLVATESITATAKIDVGSHRAANPAVGAGGDPSVCGAGTPPGNNGGGAGGSFTALGGSGGTPGGGAPAPSVNPVPALRGGCAGQDGGGGSKGLRGHGGGAVYLIAATRIDITGGIDAAGSGGTGATNNQSGGGGGGSGGMIGLEAPTITVSGLVLANGGGGGEGASSTTAGNPGSDATSTSPAPGGSNGTNRGGDGGTGSSATLAGPGFSGNAGDAGQGGGGGGGGAAGIILAPANALVGNAQLSPPVTTPEQNRQRPH